MYEGQPIICKELVEEHWLDFLKFVKQESDKDIERQIRRMEKMAEVDAEFSTVGKLQGNLVSTEPSYPEHRYYDLNLNTFWSWYISTKI